jgi:hypothetical protein
MSKSINDAIDKMQSTESKLKQFSDILDGLETTEDKKKLLWKEIYENALDDRTNAQILFDDLMIQSRGNTANHAMFGSTMSKYLERMAKSNDQILKLAELIAKEEEKTQISVDDIFNQIQGD